MLLSLLAWLPDLHAKLHDPSTPCVHNPEGVAKVYPHGDNDTAGAVCEDPACAITLFAAGCEAAVPFVLCPPLGLHAEGVASFTERLFARTLPGPQRVCGPPARA